MAGYCYDLLNSQVVAVDGNRVDLLRGLWRLILQKYLLQSIRAGLVNSAHDLSEGGLAVALAECCFLGGTKLGAKCHIEFSSRTDFGLFGEDQSRILLSASAGNSELLVQKASEFNLAAQVIGEVVETGRLSVNDFLDVSVEKLCEWHGTALANRMEAGDK